MRRSKRLTSVTAAALAAAVLLPMAGNVHAARSAASGPKATVAFLFSDFTTSPRWQFDKQYFINDMKKLDPNVNVIVKDAHASQTTQQNEAKSVLASHVNLIIDVPVDSAQAAVIVREAHANKPRVPVISYDRLITGAKSDAYVSFNGYQVGVDQGNFLKSHLSKGSTIVSIAGSPTDNNAHLFHSGAMAAINGYFKIPYDKYTPNWDQTTAQQEMTAALQRLNNKLSGVLVANDTMASGVIAALTAQHLNGKVLVTGQDATVTGLQQILAGNQSMTVYKPIRLLAKVTSQAALKLIKGKKVAGTSKTSSQGAGMVPTILRPVTVVTKANLWSTVVKDGYVTKSAICTSGFQKYCR